DDTRGPEAVRGEAFDKLRTGLSNNGRPFILRQAQDERQDARGACSIHGSRVQSRTAPVEQSGMLFNSYEYLIYFLPLALAAYFLLGRRATWAVGWLVACSLFFYGWWNPKYLPLILASIGFNFAIGRALHRKPRHAKALLAFGVAAN